MLPGEQSVSLDLSRLIIKGDYAAALLLATEKGVLIPERPSGLAIGAADAANTFENSAAYFSALQAACGQHASAASTSGSDGPGQSSDRLLELLLLAVAALLAFVQANLTG